MDNLRKTTLAYIPPREAFAPLKLDGNVNPRFLHT